MQRLNFPKKNPNIGSDLVVIQKERYMRPNFHRFGKEENQFLRLNFKESFIVPKRSAS